MKLLAILLILSATATPAHAWPHGHGGYHPFHEHHGRR